MSGLLWPGDERAAGVLDDAAVVTAMLAVEDAWLASLVEAGVAPAEAAADLTTLLGPADLPPLAAGAEAGGNPVIGLVALLRERAGGEAGRWLHRGLTSQDVVDTALLLAVRDALDLVTVQHRAQLGLLDALVSAHRDTPVVARTLTQHAVPTTFGLKAAGWATGVLAAATLVDGVRTALPVQVGGAAGSMAAAVELAGGGAAGRAAGTELVTATARRLGLAAARPWHTTRQPVTAVGDALVTATDAWGHLAADVLSLTRSEVAEVSETPVAGGGGSSTMPHKANPVLAVLVRRAALAAPALAQTLHLASATAVDERSDGAWHVEWETLALLARRTVTAAGQVTDLLAGLRVDEARMAATLAAARSDGGGADGGGVDAEQRSMAALVGRTPADDYRGASDDLIDATLDEIRAFLTTGAPS